MAKDEVFMVLTGREASRYGALGSGIVFIRFHKEHVLLFHNGLQAGHLLSQGYRYHFRLDCFLVTMSVALIEDKVSIVQEEIFNWITEKWGLSEYGSSIVRSCVVV